MTTIEERTEYPIKEILTDIAQSHSLPLKHFTQEYFLPEAQREQFPILFDLSNHLAFPYKIGIEIAKDKMVAFEASNQNLSLAYFGREVEQYSNIIKEQGLVCFNGRRIHIALNKNGNGHIEIIDLKAEKARYNLGEDSFGGSFDVNPKGTSGFRQHSEGSKLPGVRAFLETMLE